MPTAHLPIAAAATVRRIGGGRDLRAAVAAAVYDGDAGGGRGLLGRPHPAAAPGRARRLYALVREDLRLALPAAIGALGS
jgi:hypothetical protein